MSNATDLPFPRLIVIAVLALAAALPAVDLPLQAIVAINPAGDGEGLKAGGAAIVLDADEGLLLTLAEVVPDGTDTVAVRLADGRSFEASVVRRGGSSTGVILQLPEAATSLEPMAWADSERLRIGDATWSIGNPFDALALDGSPAISRGVVSGRYTIPDHAPGVRGRGGSVLSQYRGPVIETDAAVNDGNQGGALVDAAGRLIGLCSLGVARERKLGTAIPVHRLLADPKLDLSQVLHPPAGQPDPLRQALRQHAAAVAEGVVLIYVERPQGPGNPQAMPRPRPITSDIPSYQRKGLQKLWDQYYHQQQVFYTDQAVPALVIDAAAGLLLTANSNLHGDATTGFVLPDDQGDRSVRFKIHATHHDLDLAVLQCEGSLKTPSLALATETSLQTGDPVALLGRHVSGGPFTLTMGIVSATDRHLHQHPHPLHQTDALANYASLGGALIDHHGAVVGLLTMIGPQAHWKLNSGVAPFIASETIGKVLPQLRAGTSFPPGQIVGLGIRSKPHADGGLEVKVVSENSGAADAGLQAGDHIRRVDGRDIIEQADIHRILIRRSAGDVVAIELERDGEALTLAVELRLLN